MSNVTPIKPPQAPPPDDPAPQPLRLVTPDQLGPERMVALDAIVSEHFGKWERRQINGHWRWRPPRELNARNGAAPWQARPPALCGMPNPSIVKMLDALALENGKDFLVTSVALPIDQDPEHVIRAYMVMLGRTSVGGQFTAEFRAMSSHIELACCLALAAASGQSIEALYLELFPKSNLVGNPDSATVQ